MSIESTTSHGQSASSLKPRRVDQPRNHNYNPFDPERVTYNRSWLMLGAISSIAGLIGLRRFGKPAAAGAGMFGLAAIAHMVYGEPARPSLQHVTLRLPGLPPALDGLRIGQISDIHLGMPHTERNLLWAIRMMQREQPDLIAITGDMIGHRNGIVRLPVLLRELRAPLGIYAVPGNHDYGEGFDDVRAALSIANVPLLMNEHHRVERNGADLWVIGVDDIWDGAYDLARAVRGIPESGFRLLLAHAPDIVLEASKYQIDAQLSGHTHGGHFRLPILGPFSAPRFGVRYVMGQHRVGQTSLYVSRGLGGMPIRLLCRPEATILTLRPWYTSPRMEHIRGS